MANERGMWAGAGNALSELGKIGIGDEIGKRKEARLEKLQKESEYRAEERQLASEGRAEGRTLAAEGRAGERAEREGAARAAAEREAEKRKHGYSMAEIRAKAEEDRKNKEFEKSLGQGDSKFKVVSTEGSSLEPGSTYVYNENNPAEMFVVDPKTQKLLPVSTSQQPALPPIPVEIESAAREAAKKKVSDVTSVFKPDEVTLKDYGGSRDVAIDTLARKEMPRLLRAKGLDPAEYGFKEEEAGLVTQARQPIRKNMSAPVVLPDGNRVTRTKPVTSSQIPGVPAEVYNNAVQRLKAAGKPTDPATVQAYIEYFRSRGEGNGGGQR